MEQKTMEQKTMKISVLLVILALVLAACSSGDAPAATNAPEEPTQAAAVNPTQAVIVVTRDPSDNPFGAVDESVEVTEDPNPDAMFDSIRFVRVGGGEGAETIELMLQADGTYTRNGTAGVITPERVVEIDTLLDSLNFFNIAGDMLGPGGDEFMFTYVVTVNRAGVERTIQSDDNRMPQAYKEFVAELMSIGL